MADEAEASGYAPTYYPGVVSAAEAGKVNVAPGPGIGSIDFQILLVPFATVSGIVGGGDGTNVAAVMLLPQDGRAAAGAAGRAAAHRPHAGRRHVLDQNVPPGRYMAIARSGGRDGSRPRPCRPIVVNGQNIDGVALTLQTGVTLSGNDHRRIIRHAGAGGLLGLPRGGRPT